MKYNILIGGSAGTGPNILTHLISEVLVKKGFYVFYSRDYQSLIRGGHNFNVLTFSDKPIYSNECKIDILVALDENTLKIHKKDLKKSTIILNEKEPNMYFAGRLFKIFGLDFKDLKMELKKLGNYDKNITEAKKGYEKSKNQLKLVKCDKKNLGFSNGNQGISQGAIKSGLNVYYAYPMTPATPVLGELAQKQKAEKFKVIELENEIGVINAAVGSAITGAKSMVGTSGGGFDLMTETISMTGIAEIPLVIYLSQRPGPGTGVATYTGQGDLNIARHAGHGEFNRVVLAPGDPIESQELTNQCFYFSQKYKIPTILLGDKHLAESFYSSEQKPKIIDTPSLTKLKRYSSYEKDSIGSATEDAELINANIENRIKAKKQIEKEATKFSQYNLCGKKNSKNIIISWGSTKGAILDALKGNAPSNQKIADNSKKLSEGAIIDSIEELNCEFLQIKYIEPFPNIENLLKNKNIILIENNATGLLGDLIREKTGILIEDTNKILRYDGRPFLCDELNVEIKRRLK